MQRILITILALQILTAGQALGELIKVVNLVDHFSMHMHRGEVQDLAGFIRLHYFDPEHERSDPTRHSHLPLQQVTPHFSFVFASSAETLTLLAFDCTTLADPKVVSTEFQPQSAPMAVFQPPRCA